MTKATEELANGHHQLNPTEKMLLNLLVEKERNLMGALQEQVASFYRQVEERLGLEAGAIGTTHTLNVTTQTVENTREDSS